MKIPARFWSRSQLSDLLDSSQLWYQYVKRPELPISEIRFKVDHLIHFDIRRGAIAVVGIRTAGRPVLVPSMTC